MTEHHSRQGGTAADGYRFVGDNGDFVLEAPQRTSYLYFPLANEAGMMSSVTPLLGGDAKAGQNEFLLAPVSAEDLHNSRATRNFWVYVQGKDIAWSATGGSARQAAAAFGQADTEAVTLACGLLWHRVTRESAALGLRAEITSYVPISDEKVERMRVTITNLATTPQKLTPTAAIPLYARSADNVRDHRHVTALLHRIRTVANGVIVTPAMCFDERGHTVNAVSYSVLGANGDGKAPVGFFPIVPDFLGEGGSYDWPEAVITNAPPTAGADMALEGFEAVGALRFAEVTLAPGESASFFLALAIQEAGETASGSGLTADGFADGLAAAIRFWDDKTGVLRFTSADPDFDRWMRWVSVQPILRRIYGCSFLPHHDYGRGGRGWRDLWQDCLALLLMEPQDVRHLLYNNFAGVRIDGSNATIIGSKPGEFIADRNNISRVWMDHGAWPFLTTLLYVDQSGDLAFLLEPQVYFKDRQIRRSGGLDEAWTPEYGSQQRTASGAVYQGTLLEHILVQNVVPFYNVGDHNNIRLEGADWNDALDMARKNGESVAFTSFYAWNLQEIARVLQEITSRLGTDTIEIAEEMLTLFDSLHEKADYDSIAQKRALLEHYYDRCRHDLSGRTVRVPTEALARDLEAKASWLFAQVRTNEWIRGGDGHAWFNGYYDEQGRRVEGEHLPGQRHPHAVRAGVRDHGRDGDRGAGRDDPYRGAGISEGSEDRRLPPEYQLPRDEARPGARLRLRVRAQGERGGLQPYGGDVRQCALPARLRAGGLGCSEFALRSGIRLPEGAYLPRTAGVLRRATARNVQLPHGLCQLDAADPADTGLRHPWASRRPGAGAEAAGISVRY